MPDQSSTFEQKIARLEAIVKELDTGNIELDKAVALFKEGKALSAECEALLKGAQSQIDKVMEHDGARRTEAVEDDIPF